jgi:Kef-type K+ transport system membrane component KefB
MPETSFTSLAVILAVAFLAPLLLGFAPRVRLPSVVVEIVLGIIIGPAVLGWATPDDIVRVLSTIGLAFLLFLGGLELDLRAIRGTTARIALLAFAVSFGLAVVCGLVLDAVGLVHDPLLAAVILTATSLGLVVPVLKEAGRIDTQLGQLVIAGASIGDFGAIILLSALFSTDSSGPGAKVVLLVEFVIVVGLVVAAIGVSGRSMRVGAVLQRLQDTTAEIRVRGAVLLLVVLIVMAQRFGLETILGAFVAGAVVGFVDRDAKHTHPLFRVKLDAIGYGFLVPVFFVTSGVTFDLHALTDDPTTIALVPVFLVALLVARGVPAVLYRSLVGARGALVAGLFQATSLPFIVAATQIGVGLHALSAATAAAFVAAGLVSALVFPATGLRLLRRDPDRSSAADPRSTTTVEIATTT